MKVEKNTMTGSTFEIANDVENCLLMSRVVVGKETN